MYDNLLKKGDYDALTEDFVAGVKVCTTGRQRRERWLQALRTLESDPIFEEADVKALLDVDTDDLGRSASRLFRKLSSGHKIVLLTITKLVERVEERTLVLMDEPTEGVAPVVREQIVDALKEIADMVSVVIVEQNLDTALALSDQGHVIERGRIIASGNVREMHQSGLLEKLLAV